MQGWTGCQRRATLTLTDDPVLKSRARSLPAQGWSADDHRVRRGGDAMALSGRLIKSLTTDNDHTLRDVGSKIAGVFCYQCEKTDVQLS